MSNLLKKRYFFSRTDQSGQVLLIVVLIMLVSLTVGLSVVSRSITDVRISAEEESSQRAFSAAEAGIEKALKAGVSTSFTIGSGQSVNATFTETSQDKFIANNKNFVEQNEGIDVWLVPHNSDGTPNFSASRINPANFLIFWGASNENCASNPPTAAAIEVVVVYAPSLSPTTRRYAIDPCTTSGRRTSNNFSTNVSTGSYSILDTTFKFKTNAVDVVNGGINGALLVRIIPLYAQTMIAVASYDPTVNPTPVPTKFPSQGKQIESKGASAQSVRKITVFQPYPKLSNEFFYTLLKPIQSP